MFCSINIWAQNSFSLNGLWNVSEKSTTLLNNYESNTSSYLKLKDWGLSVSYGGEFSNPASSNLYLISLSKTFNKNTITARYTPGYEKEFIFNNGSAIILQDSSFQQLTSKFTYNEILGLGYSYRISPSFSLGLSVRYYTQDFSNETFKPVSQGDTLYYLERENESEKSNFWRGDIGLNYFVNSTLSFSIASLNLFKISEGSISDDNSSFVLKTKKGALFGLFYSPIPSASLNVLYETNNSFQAGYSHILNINNSTLGLSLASLHDKYQSPFITGLVGSISYANDLFGITFSGVKYFSDRNKSYSFSEFKQDGIHNLMNNKYSYDKATVTISFTLNTIKEQSVQFLSVDVAKQIYPTFASAYIDSPFAFGKVVNLTDKPVLVKPSSKIERLNTGFMQSPAVTINPSDTTIIPFYAILSEEQNKQRSEIAEAYFSLTTSGDEPDDEFQRPVLVNSINSWDGNVVNLKYFIKKDLDYSMRFSKNILSNKKNALDTINYLVSDFYKAKSIFDNLVKELVYASDPRASTEYVQFPSETIKLKGGDCDDLSVCYSSLLESIGIETALVDYKNSDEIRHVNILFNTNLAPSDAKLITENDTKYFIRKDENDQDEIWIPIETTSLTDFDTAWNIGAEKFFNEAINNLGLATGKIQIIDVY
jgi:hypothetical protein